MSEQPADLVDRTFRDMLNQAITCGRRPRRTTILGAATWAAIDALAREHPDATAHHFAAAHDAFAFEHTNVDIAESLASDDPLTAKAAEFAAMDALVAQLKISYPDVDPETIAALVRHAHADFDGHPIRDFVPLFVERAVHRRLA